MTRHAGATAALALEPRSRERRFGETQQVHHALRLSRRGSPAARSGERRANLGAAIAATLKGRIIAWRYPPEYRLVEEALCREFGVSRSPVREALRLLVASGLVRRTPSRGYAVRHVDLAEIEELYAVRLALELFVVETLARRAVESKTLARLKRAWSSPRQKSQRTGAEMAALDAKFHEELAALLENQTLLRQLESINERLYVIRMIDFERPGRIESTSAEHLQILARVAAGDAAGARNALRRNIENGHSNVRAAIKNALTRLYVAD